MIELSSKCKNDTFLFHVDLQQKFNLNFWFNVFMLTVCKLWKYSECITAACPSEKKKKTVYCWCAAHIRFCDCTKRMSIYSGARLHKPRLKAMLTPFQKLKAWNLTQHESSTEFQKNVNPTFYRSGKSLRK